MKAVQRDPWNLVTDTYIEPNNFAELFSLLVPCHPKVKERTNYISVERKEFYKEENLAAFIVYGMNKAKIYRSFIKMKFFSTYSSLMPKLVGMKKQILLW